MYRYSLLIIIFVFLSCADKPEGTTKVTSTKKVVNTKIESFQTILDASDVKGSILIYDLNKNEYFSNDFDWAKERKLPASTYKIPHSIIALETGVLKDENAIIKWDGKKRFLKTWERDLTLKDAFQLSCVPCYQGFAKKIGTQRMNEYLEKLNYGKMQVDSSNVHLFWLEGESGISQYEQIDFLKRLYLSELPINKTTQESILKIMIVQKTQDYTLRAKTGWSIRNGNNNGWYVGYLSKGEEVFFFATNIEPANEFNRDMFLMIRKDISLQALRHMKLID